MEKEDTRVYIAAQCTCAFVEALGMMAHNLDDQNTTKYSKKEFDHLIEKYNIHHNGVISDLYPR